jgi:hypothetical protein
MFLNMTRKKMTNSRGFTIAVRKYYLRFIEVQTICNNIVMRQAYAKPSYNQRLICKEIPMALAKMTTLSNVMALSACATMNVTADADVKHHAHGKHDAGHGKFEFALIGDVPYGVLPGGQYPP